MGIVAPVTAQLSQLTSRSSNNTGYAYGGTIDVDRIYANNGLNQVTTAGATAISYDGRGNLLTQGAVSFAPYDLDNRLTGMAGVGAAALAYDPADRLYQVTSAGITVTLYEMGRSPIHGMVSC